MRIAVSFPGCHRRGGVERVVLEAANYLTSQQHDVHLFASEWDDDELATSITRHKVDFDDGLPWARVRRFPKRCRAAMQATSIDFDAHAAFGVMSPPGGLIWVQSVHAAWLTISRAQRNLSGRLRQRINPYHPLILSLERRVFAARRYQKLIALTDQVKQDLIDHYAVPDADIEVLSNGFAPAEFNPERRQERNEVRRELGLPADRRVVVFVANETERKGFGPLLRAIAKLGEPDIHLLAVGGLDAAAYRAEIARLGMTERVHFTGPMSDVARAYAAADVFALPTQYEAWGLVIVEAMACGLPVLTSRLAGAAVAVEEGQTGELLDNPRDVEEIATKLGKLLTGNHEATETIGESVKSYAWGEVLRRYEATLCGEAPAAL